MKRLLIMFLVIAPCCMAQVSVPIQNPSFESPVQFNSTAQCGLYVETHIPGWSDKPFDPLSWSSGGVSQWTCVAVPDGKNVAFSRNVTFYQDIGLPQPNVVYTLKLWVANWFYNYPGWYKVALSIGPTELCAASGLALGDFVQIPLVCPVPGYIILDNGAIFGFHSGDHLFVSLSNTSVASGWPVLIDNVSLQFTPQS